MNTIKNSVRLIGNLGAAPTIINTDKGSKIARVSIATSDYYYNDKKEKVTDTYWHNLVFFNKSAELLFSLADTGKIKICVSSLSFSNIDYCISNNKL